MKKSLNILLVHNFYQNSGGEDSVFFNEYNMLMNAGHNVIKYTEDNSDIKKMNIFQKMFLPFTMIYSFKTKRNIKKIIKENNIDIIHVHNILNLISPSVFYIAKKMNIPVVQTIHNFRYLCPNGLFYRDSHICEECPNKGLKCSIKHNCYRGSKLQTIINVLMLKIHRTTKIYKNANFIFLTEFNRDKFIQYNKSLNIFDTNKFYIKPNFITSKDQHNNFLFLEKKNQYIYVGRTEKEKGIFDLVKIWENVTDAKLIICGSGSLDNQIKNLIQEKHLNVEHKGFMPHEKVFEEISQSIALIFPSTCYEGFPMTLIESLNMNIPVIARNIGNASSIVNKESGLLYDTEKEFIEIINKGKIKGIKPQINKLYLEKDNYLELENIYKNIMEEKK